MGSAMPGVESIGRPGSGFLLWLRVQRAKKIWTEVWSAMLGGGDPDLLWIRIQGPWPSPHLLLKSLFSTWSSICWVICFFYIESGSKGQKKVDPNPTLLK